MMINIEWSSPAFRWLEKAQQHVAFEVVKRTDLLMRFPEMGSSMELQFPEYVGFRQLIVLRDYRVVYRYVRDESAILIFIIMRTKQTPPSVSRLNRDFKP